MKKLALILGMLLVISLFLVVVFRTVKGKVREDLLTVPPQTQPPTITALVGTNEKTTKSLFVPYWTLSSKNDFSGYETLIYFGISPTREGINVTEEGYRKLSQFVQSTEGTKTYLTLRMIDSSTNLAILEDPTAQKTIIVQTLSLAQDNGFDGVVLDLELSALPFDSLLKKINVFVQTFARDTRQANLEFALAMYGDTFYRIRPFDVKTISESVDNVFIMVYDFHKSGGNPGPNFPLSGKEKYGYDFQTMLSDFTRYFGGKEITIVYGMFGYDWEVTEDGKAVTRGEPLSIHQVQQRILDKCEALSCNIKKDTATGEVAVYYQAEGGKPHIVWFETEESAAKKETVAKTMGVSRSSFWAYSYF